MANLKGPGRLPSPENLIAKSPAELTSLLGRFGITVDTEGIDRRAKQAYLKFAAMVDEGTEPDDATWERIDKQVESDISANLRKTAKEAIRQYREDALPDGVKLVWITRGEGSCPSCEKRHGMIRTMPQWEALGLPGSAALFCQDECNCQLIPTE